MDPQTQTPQDGQRPPELHPLVVLRPGERVICEIKRHPFGVFTMYASGAFAIIVITVLAILAPSYIGEFTFDGNVQSIALGIAAIISIGVIAILLLATNIYWQNRWIITDDSITQISQNGLFGRKVSQLSMESLEDITVDKNGIIQTMFNFGTLHAETAGEKSKFVFIYCPDPNKYARMILQAHEMFLHQTRHQPQAVMPVDSIAEQPVLQQAPQQHYAQQVPPAQQQFVNNQGHPYQPGQPAQNPPQFTQPVVPQLPHQPAQQTPQQNRSHPAIWGD